MGILRAGHILFPVSVRNGAAAVADLLRRTGCRHVLVSNDRYMLDIAEEAAREVAGVALNPVQTFAQLFSDDILDHGTECPWSTEYDVNDVAMILHSSGMANVLA